MQQPEIRKDYLFDRYVIMAAGRMNRPRQLVTREVNAVTDSPFTPDKIAKKNILHTVGRGEQQVVAIRNIFPAVTVHSPKAYGYHEVVIETPLPSLPLSDLPLENLENAILMHAHRTKVLMKDKKIQYVLCCKNEGVKSGASIRHAHSQIMALGILPPLVAEEAQLVAEYKKRKGSDFYDDLIRKEMKSSRRIFEDRHFAAFAPYASAYHYETWIIAKRQVDNITRLTKSEIASLAKLLKKLLGKIDALGLSYNFFSHQVVSNRHQRFCLKIEPRDSIWGGLELGSGIVVNSVLPEQAARYYRAK